MYIDTQEKRKNQIIDGFTKYCDYLKSISYSEKEVIDFIFENNLLSVNGFTASVVPDVINRNYQFTYEHKNNDEKISVVFRYVPIKYNDDPRNEDHYNDDPWQEDYFDYFALKTVGGLETRLNLNKKIPEKEENILIQLCYGFQMFMLEDVSKFIDISRELMNNNNQMRI